jgi:hypothetical protein
MVLAVLARDPSERGVGYPSDAADREQRLQSTDVRRFPAMSLPTRISGRRPSPALVVACIALGVALSGTGIAAVMATLPANSVGTAQLQSNAVTAAKVRNGSLTKADFRPGQLPNGIPGSPGPAGPQGLKGDTGPTGAAGIVGDMTLHSATVNVPAYTSPGVYSNRSIQANCDVGEKGVGGGTNWEGEGDAVQFVTVLSTPIYDAVAKKITGWRARGGNDTNAAHNFTVYVFCTK